MNRRTVETDVLVIGGGGAGFRAAIGAREKGLRVALVSKGSLARCGASPMAGADLTADGDGLRRTGFPGEPRDSKETWFRDIVHQGYYLNNQKLLNVYVTSAPDRVEEMVRWGIKIRRSEERAIYTTGTSIMDALWRKLREVRVDTFSDTATLELLMRDGRVVGALALDICTGEFITFKAKSIVLATGGWHKAYIPVTGSRELTGDGIAMAFRAGAQLLNMEFVTFCCNIALWPPRWAGSIITYVLGMRPGATLVNGADEEFLSQYDPTVVRIGTQTEWNKSFVSYATAHEVRAGKGSPHGGVFLKVRGVPWDKFEKIATTLAPGWKYKVKDFTELAPILKSGDGVEVGPSGEYFDGGILVNECFETTVPGLYAAGECTGGLFGSNRVSAATTEMLVGGAIAGHNAAEYAMGIQAVAPDDVDELEQRALAPLKGKEGIRATDLRVRIQQMVAQKMSPIKTDGELRQYIAFVDKLRTQDIPTVKASSPSRRYNKEWVEALELENLATCTELSARAALARTESRGVHFRQDYPVCDNDQWLKEIVFQKAGRGVKQFTRPVTATELTPPKGVTPFLDMLKQMMQAHSDIGGAH